MNLGDGFRREANCLLLLLSICYIAAIWRTSDALPSSLRAYSRVVYKKPDWQEPELATVEEFANQKEANAMFKVKLERSKNPTYKNYYLINGATGKGNDQLIEYDADENECAFVASSGWPLGSVTSFLERMRSSSEVRYGKERAKDRTALGPIALLRLVLANAEQFKLGSSSSEQGETYFMAAYNMPDKQLLRVIVSIPEGYYQRNLREREQAQRSTRLLSDLNLEQLNTLKVSFVVAKQEEYTAGCGPNILFENLSNLESLHISFVAIEERSVAKHQGLSALDSDDEENPFTLPRGVGCGSRGKLFFLNARQFSGLFTGEKLHEQQFVAFDGRSNHLRMDRVGRSKMIYNLGSQKSIVFVADEQLEREGGGSMREPKEKCASVLLQKQPDGELNLVETRSLADVIGFDLGTGLNYLGSRTLEDGVHCLVFEREVSSISKIPLLARLNQRLTAQESDRLYLTLYFVDEFRETKNNAEQTASRSPQQDCLLLDSMWLKRIELLAKKSVSKHTQLVSQVTFSQSAWNLNVWAEYEDDRRSRNLHPVRTFDTMECKPSSENAEPSFKLELIIEQIAGQKVGQFKQIQDANSQQPQFGFPEQTASLEEAVMAFIGSLTRIPRSHINHLELVLPEHRLAQSQRGAPPIGYKIFAAAEIVDPLEFQFARNLVGWVQSYKEIALALKDDVVLLRADDASNNRHECMLTVATALMKDVRRATMLFCPRVGCGHVKDLGSFAFIRAESGKDGTSGDRQTNGPTVGNYYEMCEIYALTRIALPVDTGNKLNAESVKSQLTDAKFSMNSMLGRSQADSASGDDFLGKVVKVSAIKQGQHPSHSLGLFLRSGLCFSDDPARWADANELRLVHLRLAEHQSSAIVCHKACLLYARCRTYSYSSARRTCTLTGLPRAELLAHSLRHSDRFTKDPTCHLYGLNALRLYSSLQMSLITSLQGLDSTHQYFFTRASKESCASLCHDNELAISDDPAESCHSYKYFNVYSMCAIDDKRSHLYKKQLGDQLVASLGSSYTDKSKHFRSLLNDPSEWADTNQCQFYERDYAQYFEHKARTKFEVPKELAASAKVSPVGELKTLFDIDLSECLRECSMIEQSCMMINHCFHPISGTPTRYCTMFQLRDESAERDSDKSLAELLQSMDKISDKELKPEFKINPACNTYQLTEDYFMLKGKLARAAQQNGKDVLLDEIGERDANKSATYLEGMKASIEERPLTAKDTSSGEREFSFWSATMMVLTGSVSGVLLALLLVAPTRVRPTIEVISNSSDSCNSIGNISGFRLAPSPSIAEMQLRPEMNELFELYENY